MTVSTFNQPHMSPCRNAALPIAVLLLLAAATSAPAQRSYPPAMEGTTSEVYRTVGDVELNIYLCNPEGHSADDRRPAIVFFFGGGWRAGSPQQFLPHCRYLAERGMVAAVADYRVATRHGVTAHECVEDAKSAVRWLRSNADRLGVDPNRIAAGGGSAGGHLAAATATLPGHDPDPDGVSPVPNALVLFNPATVLAPVDGDPLPTEEQRERFAALEERFGAPPESMSPFHHLRADLPPTILFHGQADETVPHSTADRFCRGLRDHKNRCDFVSYHDQGHGFFNFGRGEGEDKNKWYEDTVSRMDGFLYSLEWLDPKPNPDGTPGERLTWQESLSRALGSSAQGLPRTEEELQEFVKTLGNREGDDPAAEAGDAKEDDDPAPPDGDL
jgi:acetyl esterase/lipase